VAARRILQPLRNFLVIPNALKYDVIYCVWYKLFGYNPSGNCALKKELTSMKHDIMNRITRKSVLFLLSCLFTCKGGAVERAVLDKIDVLSLDIISYEDFAEGDSEALDTLKRALFKNGIVGIRGVPGYREKVLRFIDSAKEFSALPEKVKEAYAPDHSKGEMFLGYERGKEKFKHPDGRWLVDDLKVSYYGYVPENPLNKWPREMDLSTPFQEIGMLMAQMGKAVMEQLELIGPKTGIYLDDLPQVGRMLYYRKSTEGTGENPLWCGAHFDHGMFTVLLPAFYFANGEAVAEPREAGLFVRTTCDGLFKKVVADDPNVMLFQVGEFGQIVTDDVIQATEHRVHKASGPVERYTMALFFEAPMDYVVHSYSALTSDARYGGLPGAPCSYRRWTEESFKRYIVKEEEASQ